MRFKNKQGLELSESSACQACKMSWIPPSAQYELGVVAQTCDPITEGCSGGQANQEFKVTLGYIVRLFKIEQKAKQEVHI